MRVVALVSGGKDSCYNMMLCEKFGHEIVALANLLPADQKVDDLDSYMFQTVGHQLIAAYAQCTGIPVFRRKIQGESLEKNLAYKKLEGDEVEDMFSLLAYVKKKFPNVQGVSSGAIASDYQRLRVENVCGRLGLVSLAYLWHEPQAKLLREMIDGNLEAILVKVAAIGLDPQKHLGKELASVEGQLFKIRDLYGCNVCGEGGEYETLVLNCPLFKYGRIVLDAFETVITAQDEIAPSGVLHPTSFRIEGVHEDSCESDMGNPGIVDVTNELLEELHKVEADEKLVVDGSNESCQSRVKVTDSEHYVHIVCEANVTSMEVGIGIGCPMKCILTALERTLEDNHLGWEHCIFVHLYLSNMADFATANSMYCQHFPRVSPPSRACVELPLASTIPCSLDVLLYKDALNDSRRILHVQSISQWAPSCIGPYSQATCYKGIIHIAGQLGLDPPTMELVKGGYESQLEVALAHCESVCIAMGSNVRSCTLNATVYVSKHAWSSGLSSSKSNVIIGKKLPGIGYWGSGVENSDLNELDENDNGDLDSYLKPPTVDFEVPTLVTYVCVPKLPKGADVEVQPNVLDCSGGRFEEDGYCTDSSSGDCVNVTESKADGLGDLFNVELDSVIHESKSFGSLISHKFSIKQNRELHGNALFFKMLTHCTKWMMLQIVLPGNCKEAAGAARFSGDIFNGIRYALECSRVSWGDVCLWKATYVDSLFPVMDQMLKNVEKLVEGQLECGNLVNWKMVPVNRVGVTLDMDCLGVLEIWALNS